MADANAAKKAPEQAAAPASVASAKPVKDKLGLMIFALNLVNLAMVAGMGFFMQKMWSKVRDVNAQAEKILARAAKDKATPDEAPAVGKELQPKAMGILYPMDSFLVNINSDQGPKFLQAQMEFELEDQSVEEELARKRPAVRDAIIVLLSNRSFRQLREANGMKVLRADLLHAINNLLSNGKVKDIYFTQFHFN